MTIHDKMASLELSRAELARLSQTPDSTLRDILNGEAVLEHCQAATVCRLASALEMSVEELLRLEPLARDMPMPSKEALHEAMHLDRYLYIRDAILQLLNGIGAEDFIQAILREHFFEDFYAHREYAEALFLLGLMDYLCDCTGTERITRYAPYRGDMMETPVFPRRTSGHLYSMDEKLVLLHHAIPQLIKYNIVEAESTLKQY